MYIFEEKQTFREGPGAGVIQNLFPTPDILRNTLKSMQSLPMASTSETCIESPFCCDFLQFQAKCPGINLIISIFINFTAWITCKNVLGGNWSCQIFFDSCAGENPCIFYAHHA